MISLNPNLLEALDKVKNEQLKKRSELVTEALLNYPDIYGVYEDIKRVNKP